ncbi:MAG: hypothetical protein WAV15_03570 [Minisyncoccia bacterium]
MKKTTKYLTVLIVFMVLITPLVSFGAGLVPDCSPKCGWKDLMFLVNGVINFLLFKMAVPIAAIMFAFAGFKMLTAGGEAASARTKAKEIFINTLFGLIIAIAAWLIISTLLFILGYDGSWIGLKISL